MIRGLALLCLLALSGPAMAQSGDGFAFAQVEFSGDAFQDLYSSSSQRIFVIGRIDQIVESAVASTVEDDEKDDGLANLRVGDADIVKIEGDGVRLPEGHAVSLYPAWAAGPALTPADIRRLVAEQETHPPGKSTVAPTASHPHP